jgi:chaperonin GroEL (HSP60 family)
MLLKILKNLKLKVKIKKLVLTCKKALEAPIRQITKNAGVDGSVVVGKLLEQNKKTQGYDAQNEEYCDMFAKGIIDPVKVVRTALTRCCFYFWITCNYRSYDC